jgi:hypothetical protein
MTRDSQDTAAKLILIRVLIAKVNQWTCVRFPMFCRDMIDVERYFRIQPKI